MIRSVLGCFALAFIALSASAEVYVNVDRTSVQTNESFTLILNADEGEAGEPDITGLDEHFDILGRNQSSSISLVNGQRSSSRRWTYVLLPKGPGRFEIPALKVGGAGSDPVAIVVQEATVEAPGEADVFFEVAIDRESSWVQAQVIYTIKLYLGVATRQTSLAEPVIEGGDVLIERLAEDRRYEAQVSDRLYTVVERSFAIFPQTSGELTITPARFTASLWERGRISSPRVFSSQPLSLSVAPIVPPPARFAGADWLPASNIALSADLRPEDGILEPGEPANVRMQMTALGLLSAQLPELELESMPGLRVYPDQPDLQSRATPNSVTSTRQQSFAVIAASGGVFDLPDVALPWFNTETAEWEVTTLTLPSLRAAGSVTATPQQAAAPAEPESPTTAAQSAGPETESLSLATEKRLFRLKLMNYLLLALWLVTLWFIWRLGASRKNKRKKARKDVDTNAPFRSAQKAFKRIHKACKENDAASARSALLVWAQAYWPDQSTNTLGDIINRIPSTERQPIEALNRYFYHPAVTEWDGRALHKALHKLNQPGVEAKLSHASGLPPLLASQD
ncbi:MAG: BatD family protein [Woeseiaceae bacterium]